MFWIVAVSIIFGLAGILIGLWSKSFEQLNMPVVFFLTPLSMLGGSFFTMKMLPDWLHWLLWANPFFYFINGIRGAMIGVDEAPQGLSIGLTLLMIAVLGGLVWRLFSPGLRACASELSGTLMRTAPRSAKVPARSHKRPIPVGFPASDGEGS